MTAEPIPALEVLMDAAWPAPDRHDTGEWVLRAAEGVTQRANSVWPRASAADPAAAAREAVAWYRKRRLPVIYQVFNNASAAPLNALLDRLGFTNQSETLVMAMGPAAPEGPLQVGRLPAGAAVELAEHPSAEWLELWWSVDGRGGAGALETARAILTGCPSLYALVRDDSGRPAAVGRLALAGGYGGLYCMATRPDARLRGYATRVLRSLLAAGAARNLDGYWLLVTAANPGARELYARSGFREAGRYFYRQERPRRHLTGC
ncbi:GNAT superfamily N-acetyltransferase [Arthrobacter pascens]|uniref:GNAT family N-acetyltransferase n=1 Tax=Arthrobacter pascens TaxID=1677 RepID=UPI00286548CD|nr:GNAT family N-acetyltransferase [Arthrobacter pascens]MDR6556751.1 GNAT superfamily N-acetyltransferase [Arthrobacter pascens]